MVLEPSFIRCYKSPYKIKNKNAILTDDAKIVTKNESKVKI